MAGFIQSTLNLVCLETWLHSLNTQQCWGAFLHVPYFLWRDERWSARVLTTDLCRISSVSQHSATCRHFSHQPLGSIWFLSLYQQCDVSGHLKQVVGDLSGTYWPALLASASRGVVHPRHTAVTQTPHLTPSHRPHLPRLQLEKAIGWSHHISL